MLVILPPSETKRSGGRAGSRLDLAALSSPALTPARRRTLAAVRELARDPDAARRALKLGKTQDDELARNREVTRSATMPAIDRYDGVLFDALDAATLTDAERARAGERVVIASALFGLVGALDPIPAYRLSHDSRLPGLPLTRHWRAEVARELAVLGEGRLVLDLRSESYVRIGPAPAGSWYLRVVSQGDDGRRRALNHFNKSGKGVFVRRLLGVEEPLDDVGALLGWAREAGARLERGAPGELDLVV